MGLLPSAPAVELRIPGTVFAGQPTQVRVEVTTKDALKIDFVALRVLGIQGWQVGQGKSQVTHRVTYPRYETHLVGPCVLEPGSHGYETAFTLPPDIAPSHVTGAAYGRLEVRVHVSIPWWPDTRQRYDVLARLPWHGELQRQPITTRSTNQAGKPRLELALASNRLIAGEMLVGSCALFHVDDRKPREIELNLVPDLTLIGRGRPRERTGTPLRMVFEMPAGTAGLTLPFRFMLPADLTPSFACDTHVLRWFLIAKTGSFFGPRVEVTVPLEIADRTAAIHAPHALVVAPHLADQKIAETFAAFAERAGWRVAPPSADDGDEHPVVTAADGAHTLVIAYAYRKGGAVLVARVEHPSLGLDLAVVPGTVLRHAFFHDIEIDDAGWDRAHHVTARSAEQAVPFLRQVVPAVRELADRDLATFVRWDDDALVVERPVAQPSARELEALAATLAVVSGAIARAVPSIPPPPGVVLELDAWRRTATALDATLVTGELAIDGAFGGVAASVELVWRDGDDGEHTPLAIRAHVGDAVHASELVRRVALALATPALPPATLTLPDGVADALAAWPLDLANLRVANGVASVELAIGADRVADGARALDLVKALRALLDVLDPGAGPYR